MNYNVSGQEQMVGCFEHGNETPSSITRKEFLTTLLFTGYRKFLPKA